MCFSSFIEEIKKYSKLADEALDGDRTKWQEIFGERFPKQPKETVKNEAKYDKTQTPWCC